MNDLLEISEILHKVEQAETLEEAKDIFKKYLIEVDARILEYSQQLDDMYNAG